MGSSFRWNDGIGWPSSTLKSSVISLDPAGPSPGWRAMRWWVRRLRR